SVARARPEAAPRSGPFARARASGLPERAKRRRVLERNHPPGERPTDGGRGGHRPRDAACRKRGARRARGSASRGTTGTAVPSAGFDATDPLTDRIHRAIYARAVTLDAEAAAVVALLRAGKRPWRAYSNLIEEAGAAAVVLERELGLLAPDLIDAAAAE